MWKRLLLIVCLLVLALPSPAGSFADGTLRLVYREISAGLSVEREYLVERTAKALVLEMLLRAEHPVKRRIVSGLDYATLQETYEEVGGPGRVTVVREGDLMRLAGSAGNRSIDLCERLDDVAWYGSVLLLRDFVLSGEATRLFYVTKPEEERVVKLKAIREAEESVFVNGRAVDTVRVRFTMPDFRSVFWSSTYWFRAGDGLFMKSDETRGGPGTPKVQVELMSEEVI